MDTLTLEQAIGEIKRLQQCLNDLENLSALPAVLSEGMPEDFPRNLLKAIAEILDLDFIYIHLAQGNAGPDDAILWTRDYQEMYAPPEDFMAVANFCLEKGEWSTDKTFHRRIRNETLSISVSRLGLGREIGHIVTGCRRYNFPANTERLVLNAAVNVLTIGLYEASHLGRHKHVVNGSEKPVPLGYPDIAAENEILRHKILEMEKIERDLRDRERQTRLITENMPTLGIIMSPTGELEYANAKNLQFLGISLDELRSWGTNGVVYSDDLAHTSEILKHSLVSGDPFDFELRLRSARGSYHWFQATGVPLFTDDGQMERWHIFLTDIDGRKRAEKDLRARERQIIHNEAFIAEGQRLSKTGTFYWNTVTNEMRFSEENYRTNEIEPGTPITWELMASRIHPDDLGLIYSSADLVQAEGNGSVYEARLLLPSGKIKWVRTHARAYRNERGEVECIGAVQDITEQHDAEEALSKLRSELTHVSRALSLGVMTASIVHEVSQPLSGILTNGGAGLRMLSADPPNVRGALDTVRRTIRDANRASDVLTRLRAMFSRKETVSESVHLNEAAQEVIGLTLAELKRNGVVIQTQFMESLPYIHGDRVQLQQVILNLLLNASDAMKGVTDRTRQIVTKTVLEPEGSVRLTVIDSGDGIDPQQADRLFEPFYTTKGTGLGIGLSISRTIIERHHGRIWAEPNEDFGASFSFSIPIGRSNAANSGHGHV